MRQLELLAPAKNLECGMAAIDHGADAVYIGAQLFGARVAAGNSLDDICTLCSYAHQFEAKVYVTVNTIIFDEELEMTCRLLEALNDAQVDAILVQDMAIVEQLSQLSLPLVMHASTQMDNRTPEKVKWLSSLGFRRVVLARELSIAEIAEIHRQVPEVELEVFVHGALCVSYSGLCYASQHCFSRSANRGACAQFCRMKFNLLDADGMPIVSDCYLLSLKDMNQYDQLDRLIEAGATSFKIEGRLKDVNYVKNVTAAYSNRLNELIALHPDLYERASKGHCTYNFKPDLKKTFNRGYTSYFAYGRQPDIASFDTPKAIGEFVGTVKEIRSNSFNVAGTASFSNGDGLCFFNSQRALEGFRVNRVEGNRLFPLKMPQSLKPGMRLYRNNDVEMERLLSGSSASRKIPVTMTLKAIAKGFELQMGHSSVTLQIEHQQAEKPQHDNIVRQLSKLGGTPYECVAVNISDDFNYFIPSSLLAELRRKVVEVEQSRYLNHSNEVHMEQLHSSTAFPTRLAPPYLYNIANRLSRSFYESHGVQATDALELSEPKDAMLMQCKHCIRYALGYCVKYGGQRPRWKEPLYLQLGDGRKFKLEFDCLHCQMNVYA